MKKHTRIIAALFSMAFLILCTPHVFAHEECEEAKDYEIESTYRSATCTFCGGNMWTETACSTFFSSFYYPPSGCYMHGEACNFKIAYYYSNGVCQDCGHPQNKVTSHAHYYYHTSPYASEYVCPWRPNSFQGLLPN